jgi:hypothetical protein
LLADRLTVVRSAVENAPDEKSRRIAADTLDAIVYFLRREAKFLSEPERGLDSEDLVLFARQEELSNNVESENWARFGYGVIAIRGIGMKGFVTVRAPGRSNRINVIEADDSGTVDLSDPPHEVSLTEKLKQAHYSELRPNHLGNIVGDIAFVAGFSTNTIGATSASNASAATVFTGIGIEMSPYIFLDAGIATLFDNQVIGRLAGGVAFDLGIIKKLIQ